MMRRIAILLLCFLLCSCSNTTLPASTPSENRMTSVNETTLAEPTATKPTDVSTPPTEDEKTEYVNATFVKAVWVPFMEVNTLLDSGNVEECRQNIEAMLDDCVARGVNTVYFHVRANSDAYYDSAVFSPHKTTVPLLAEGFDPLAFAVQAAHERGLQLHAWVNPYRIGADATYAKTDDVFEYNGKWYYIPTVYANRKLIVDGIKELVENYAIDGVQFDDYFYPKGAVPSASTASFEQADYDAYVHGNGHLSVGDWRRTQVSMLMADVYAACHTRDNCVFGVSPGYDIKDNYDNLYADIAAWAGTNRYIDYVCPQLYFGYDHSTAAFEDLMDTWETLTRANGIELYAGLGLYKTGLPVDTYAGAGKTEWSTGGDIIARQLADVYAAKWDGAALYSHQSFVVDGERDAAIVDAECQAAVEEWNQY